MHFLLTVPAALWVCLDLSLCLGQAQMSGILSSSAKGPSLVLHNVTESRGLNDCLLRSLLVTFGFQIILAVGILLHLFSQFIGLNMSLSLMQPGRVGGYPTHLLFSKISNPYPPPIYTLLSHALSNCLIAKNNLNLFL